MVRSVAMQLAPAGGRRQAAAAAAAADTASFGLTEEEAASIPEQDWIEVGYITQPHGVYGEMKVQPLTDEPEERLAAPGPRWLAPPPLRLRRLGGGKGAQLPRRVELEVRPGHVRCAAAAASYHQPRACRCSVYRFAFWLAWFSGLARLRPEANP